eukprot:257680-Pelagomonas_calceolata.AAC.6
MLLLGTHMRPQQRQPLCALAMPAWHLQGCAPCVRPPCAAPLARSGVPRRAASLHMRSQDNPTWHKKKVKKKVKVMRAATCCCSPCQVRHALSRCLPAHEIIRQPNMASVKEVRGHACRHLLVPPLF